MEGDRNPAEGPLNRIHGLENSKFTREVPLRHGLYKRFSDERLALFAGVRFQVQLRDHGRQLLPPHDHGGTVPVGGILYTAMYGTLGEMRTALAGFNGGRPSCQILSETEPQSGFTALHFAARRPHAGIARILLEAGASVNQPAANSLGDTPLMIAVAVGCVPLMDLLIRHGAVLDVCNNFGYFPIHYAVQNKHMLAAVRLLEDVEHHVDVTDAQGHTPLHWAVFNLDETFIHFLLRRGADVNRRDAEGRTPLHWAMNKDSGPISWLLASRGATPSLDITDVHGRTPAMMTSVASLRSSAEALRSVKRVTPEWIARKHLLWRLFTFFFAYIFVLLWVWLFSTQYFVIALAGMAAMAIPTKYVLRGAQKELPGESAMFLVGIFLSCATVSCFTYFSKVILYTYRDISTIPFIIAFVVGLYLYKTLWTEDAGIVRDLHDDPTYLAIAATEDRVKLDEVCSTCWIVRRRRSKHCKTCDRCFERFDHHCLWVNNCVAVNTHKRFLFFLLLLVVGQLNWIRLCYLYVCTTPEVQRLGIQDEIWSVLVHSWVHHRDIVARWYLHIVNILWLGYLFYYQCRGIAMNMTTNERMNWERYSHLHDSTGTFRNSFDRGPVQNWINFLFGTRSSVDGEPRTTSDETRVHGVTGQLLLPR